MISKDVRCLGAVHLFEEGYVHLLKVLKLLIFHQKPKYCLPCVFSNLTSLTSSNSVTLTVS